MWTKEQQDCRPGNQLVVTLVHMTGDVDLQWGGGGGDSENSDKCPDFRRR